jgi:hypothetical protein
VDCRVQLGSLQVELAGTLGELDWCGIKMEGGHLRLTGSGLRVRAGLGDRVAGCGLQVGQGSAVRMRFRLYVSCATVGIGNDIC